MAIDRRMFLASASVVGASMGIPSALGSTAIAKRNHSQLKNPPLTGKKLVPPANGALIKVACALTKDVTMIDWVGPAAVLGAWIPDEGSRKDRPVFEVFTVGEADANFKPDYSFESAPQAQVIVVPGEADSPHLYDWLKAANNSADVTMSVCYGARQLAKLGLLDGLTATTHHDYIDPYKKEFPRVHWVRDVRFVENPNVSTSAGVTASIDLAMRVFDRYFGREKALAAARAIEYQGTAWIV